MPFSNFATCSGHTLGGEFPEIVPNELIKHGSNFDDQNLRGQITMTVSFTKALCGTELNILQEGIPTEIPSEMCYLRWQDTPEKLLKPV